MALIVFPILKLDPVDPQLDSSVHSAVKVIGTEGV